MKTCPFCKSEVDDIMSVCKCGYSFNYKEDPVVHSNTGSTIVSNSIFKSPKLLYGGITLVFVIIIAICSSGNTSDKERVLRQDQIDLLEKMNKEGYLKVEENLNRAYISSVIWNGLDAKGKEDFSAMIAIHCGNTKGNKLYWAEIFDKQSGKKLAKYSKSWGFEVF